MHEDWRPGAITEARLRTPIVERNADTTVAWLYKQCAPALAAKIKEEAIDLPSFLEYVLSL
jgi:hypothetical protein